MSGGPCVRVFRRSRVSAAHSKSLTRSKLISSATQLHSISPTTLLYYFYINFSFLILWNYHDEVTIAHTLYTCFSFDLLCYKRHLRVESWKKLALASFVPCLYCLESITYTFFFNKNKLNKNIEAEIARKIRTI